MTNVSIITKDALKDLVARIKDDCVITEFTNDSVGVHVYGSDYGFVRNDNYTAVIITNGSVVEHKICTIDHFNTVIFAIKRPDYTIDTLITKPIKITNYTFEWDFNKILSRFELSFDQRFTFDKEVIVSGVYGDMRLSITKPITNDSCLYDVVISGDFGEVSDTFAPLVINQRLIDKCGYITSKEGLVDWFIKKDRPLTLSDDFLLEISNNLKFIGKEPKSFIIDYFSVFDFIIFVDTAMKINISYEGEWVCCNVPTGVFTHFIPALKRCGTDIIDVGNDSELIVYQRIRCEDKVLAELNKQSKLVRVEIVDGLLKHNPLMVKVKDGYKLLFNTHKYGDSIN